VPELPDLAIYIESLDRHIKGKYLTDIHIMNPFLLRSVDPPLEAVTGRRVTGIERIGKRIVLCLEESFFLIIHLMIAGRFAWSATKQSPSSKIGLAVFAFDSGRLFLTEAGTKRRASLHAVCGRENLSAFDRGGLEVAHSSVEAFRQALCRENHTLKRALTDPRLFSGIGNSYSDEILHRARLSPFKQTRNLSDQEIEGLHTAVNTVLEEWTTRLREETGDGFPKKVTAFREEMAVHGKYGKPCPVCATPVQRIRYAENECDYCPVCQTGGKLLADRALSRLLKSDWPSTVDKLENLKKSR
jgi:formamidopyrimidine-DNA glycosylase